MLRLGEIVVIDDLKRQGLSVSAIARQVGLDRKTVRRQRPKPRGKPRAPNVRRGHARRATVRVAVDHVFAVQKRRRGLVVRTIGKARAEAELGLANLVTNMLRRAWFETRPAPA